MTRGQDLGQIWGRHEGDSEGSAWALQLTAVRVGSAEQLHGHQHRENGRYLTKVPSSQQQIFTKSCYVGIDGLEIVTRGSQEITYLLHADLL